MMSCKEATRLASDSLDHELPLGKRVAMGLHLLLCPACGRYLKQIKQLHELCQSYAWRAEPGDRGVRLPEAARQRMCRSIDEALVRRRG